MLLKLNAKTAFKVNHTQTYGRIGRGAAPPRALPARSLARCLFDLSGRNLCVSACERKRERERAVRLHRFILSSAIARVVCLLTCRSMRSCPSFLVAPQVCHRPLFTFCGVIAFFSTISRSRLNHYRLTNFVACRAPVKFALVRGRNFERGANF